jgi:hypothetical protein
MWCTGHREMRHLRPTFPPYDWIRVRWLGIVGVVSAFIALWPLLVRHRPLGPPAAASGSGGELRLPFWLSHVARAACAFFGMDWPFDA